MKVAIAGAGLSGATVAQRLREAGHEVSVFESRSHVAGNAMDYIHRTGIRVHHYGPHIFHTKNERVFKYLSRFTQFMPYEHRVTAMTERAGYVPFPPNRKTMEHFKREELVDVFYRPYTEFMWGKPLEEVAPKILDRVPMREDDEDRYFPNDAFQGMPINGYTAMVNMMLNDVDVYYDCTLRPPDFRGYDKVFYCGSPDSLYQHRIGKLAYRTIDFTTETRDLRGAEYLLPTATVNYTGNFLKLHQRTRVTEWSHFPNRGAKPRDRSVVTFETPRECYVDSDRYYPVRDEKSLKLYDAYVSRAKIDYPNVEFLGRCGNYVYIDMDMAVNMGLQAADRMLSKETQ